MTRALVRADAEFTKMWNDGTCVKEMAAHYSVSEATIRNCAWRNNLESRVQTPSVDVKKFRKLWHAGKSLREIAAEVGCSAPYASKIAKKEGLSSRKKRFDLDKIDRDLAVRLWFSQTRSEDIAARLKISTARMVDLRVGLRLPSRTRFGRAGKTYIQAAHQTYLQERKTHQAAATVELAAKPLPKVGGAPFWTPERDNLIRETGGRYVAVARAAEELGRPMSAVQARWHRLKAAA